MKTPPSIIGLVPLDDVGHQVGMLVKCMADVALPRDVEGVHGKPQIMGHQVEACDWWLVSS
jgi:hypothetical protein